MVHESLLRALKDNGLEEIESEGQAFDLTSKIVCCSR